MKNLVSGPDILLDEASNTNGSNVERDEIAEGTHSQINPNPNRVKATAQKVSSRPCSSYSTKIDGSVTADFIHTGKGDFHVHHNQPQTRDEEDISKNLDSYCKELKEFLINKAKSCCGIDPVLYVERPVTIAPLQISRKTREYLSDEMGHYHRRREISEMLNKPPKSDVSVEELFVKAKKHAQELASKKQSFTKEARLKYIDANGNIVAIVGQAGIGKTTLTKVLLNRIISEEKLYDADFIFYLQFRELVYGDKSDILSVLAKGFSATWMEKKSIRNAVLNRLAESKVCIIMDGFDEANLDSAVESKSTLDHNDEATAEAFIWNIFRGNIFPKAKKLITSRPRQLLELPEELRPQFVVNILGLDRKAQKGICKDICDTNDDVVFNYTQDHPDISSYCVVPVNCILVMYCINHLSRVSKSNCRMPTTLTGIFVVVLCLFIDTPQVRKHFKFKMESLRVLAELAWNGFMCNKYYFNESDLEKAGFKKEKLNSFFITILGKNKLSFFNGFSPKHTYFSHLLWQEFFVAIKLMFFVTPEYFRTTFFDETKDLSSDQSEQMKFDFTDSRFEMVAKFVFGLCNVTNYEYLHEKFPDIPEFPSTRAKLLKHMALQNLPNFTSENNFQAFLQTCTWVNKMHDELFAKVIAEKVSEDLTVADGEILPSDVAGFHYILRARSQPISISFGELWGKERELDNQVIFPGDALIRFFKEMHKTIQSSSVLIRRINLYDNEVGDEAMRHIASCISNIDELHVFYHETTFEEFKVLISGIQQLTKPMERLYISFFVDGKPHLLSTCISKIRRLDLVRGSITSEGIKAIASQIQRLKEPMKHLRLENSPIGDKGAYHLSTCINKIEDLELDMCEIQHLALEIQHLTKPMKCVDLSSNPIGDEGAYHLSTCINKIEDLKLCECQITCKGVQHLALKIQHLTNMKHLNLSYNPIKDEGAYHLSTCINKIVDLRLRDCGITSKGVQHLASEIQHLTNPMKHLHLSSNLIKDEGAYHLSTCINKIEDLKLRDCGITSKGVQHLASEIQHLTNPMKRLYLRFNRLMDEGASLLAICISKIEELDVEGCRFTSAGIKALTSEIQHLHRPMKLLDISNMQIGEDGFFAISSCIDKFETLRIGDETDRFMPMATIEELSAAVQNRTEPMEELEVRYDREFAKEAQDKLNCCRDKVKKLKLNPLSI